MLKNLNYKSRILDLGYRTGEFSHCFDSSSQTRINIEQKYIEYAKNKYNLDFGLMDGRRLRFEKDTFNCNL